MKTREPLSVNSVKYRVTDAEGEVHICRRVLLYIGGRGYEPCYVSVDPSDDFLIPIYRMPASFKVDII